MSDILDKAIVLKLNANWAPLGWTTPRKAFVDMCGGKYGGTPPALSLSVSVDENGKLTEAIPLKWEDWVKLEVRPQDLAVQTKSGAIRCPTVIVAPNYDQMPHVQQKLTKRAILERDGFVCAYSGEKLPISKLNIDHINPKSKGGKDTWENLVACRKDINTRKGNKSNKEAGLVLLKKPRAPKPVPKSFTVREVKRPEHGPFIQR
jgi:5-methylcytosine-specific restriction endonuclease McrA